MKLATVWVGMVFAALAASAPNFGSGVIAQTPDLARTPEVRPDFSGAWTRGGVMGVPGPGIPTINGEKGICVLGCTPGPGPASTPAAARAERPKPNFPVYKPEYRETVAQLTQDQVTKDTSLRCVNPGLPRIGPPRKIVQTPTEIVFLYEDITGAYWRIIPTDGRPHRDDAEEGYLGDSVGVWKGDKLVIETVGFNEDFWLTDNGAFHTSDMKVVEELQMNGELLTYSATVHDPAILAEPWTKSVDLSATRDPLEPVPCVEMSISQMTGTASYHPNPRW